MFKKFIRFYKPYKKLFILDLLAASLAAAIDLVSKAFYMADKI